MQEEEALSALNGFSESELLDPAVEAVWRRLTQHLEVSAEFCPRFAIMQD